MILNDTPVRTSKNFKINNVTIDDIVVPSLSAFSNVKISGESDTTKVEKTKKFGMDFTYGVGNVVEDANEYYTISLDEKEGKTLRVEFDFDKQNPALVENIEVTAKEDSNTTLVIAYRSDKDQSYFHQGAIKVNAKKNAKLHVILVNLLNVTSQHLMSVQNTLEENVSVDYTIIDFGAKNTISNWYANLVGAHASSKLSTIYLGSD